MSCFATMILKVSGRKNQRTKSKPHTCLPHIMLKAWYLWFFFGEPRQLWKVMHGISVWITSRIYAEVLIFFPESFKSLSPLHVWGATLLDCESLSCFGNSITSEHHDSHHFRTQPFLITSEHASSHHLRTQGKHRTSWERTGTAIWEVPHSKPMCVPKKSPFRDCCLHHAFNCLS